MPIDGNLSERVLILAPVGRDAELLAQALKTKGLVAEICPSVDGFCEAFEAGCGAVLLTEEALYSDPAHCMRSAVADQPTWSEVPFVVLTSRGQADERVRLTLDLMQPLRSATVIERPVRPGTIVTAVQGALRDRARQYEVRDAIEALRASESRLAGITDSVDQMIWSTLPDGFHDYYNARWYEFTGVPAGSTDGVGWNEMFHPDDQERAWGVWRNCLQTGEPYHIEYRLRHRSGHYRWVIGRAQPVRDEAGNIVRWYGTCTDIEDLKKAEEALREMNENLERQVEARTADLVAKIGELEGFCYSVSHDMRTPLRAIVSNAAMVLEEEGDAVSLDGRERLERLSAASMKMARLIDDLLQYARLSATEPRRESCDLTELARRIADEALIDRPGTDASIVVAPGLTGPCDPRLIGLVFHNLIDNALKYSSKDRPARLEIGQEPDGAFVVRDNGIGFDMAYASKIFQPFERLHRDGDYAGTGIGLANAQRIVERHGGRIWAEGVSGEGATFRFTLG